MKRAKKIVALVSLVTMVLGSAMTVFGAAEKPKDYTAQTITEKNLHINSVIVGKYPSISGADDALNNKIKTAVEKVFYNPINPIVTSNIGGYKDASSTLSYKVTEENRYLQIDVSAKKSGANVGAGGSDYAIGTYYYDKETKKEIATKEEFDKLVKEQADANAAYKKEQDAAKAAADKKVNDEKAAAVAAEKYAKELAEAKAIGETKRLDEAKASAAAFSKLTLDQALRDFSIGRVFMVPLINPYTTLAGFDLFQNGNLVVFKKGYLYKSMKLNENSYPIGVGEYAPLEYPPVLVDGQVYVPYTFFEKVFDIKISFNPNGTIKEITGFEKYLN